MTHNRRLVIFFRVLYVFISGSCLGDEVPAIHAMLDRIETAYKQHDRSMLAGQFSESGYLFLNQGGAEEVSVLSRQQMLDTITDGWQNLESLRFESRQIDCRQDYAILYLTAVVRNVDGRTFTQKGLSLARKESNDWKICFGMERFFQPALLVTELKEPASAAKQAGVQKGDIILEINGQMPMVSYLADGQQFTGSDKTAELTLLRDQKRFNVTIPAGPWGLAVQPQLIPDGQARWISDPQPHPTKDIIQEQIEGSITGDVDRMCKAISPDGFIMLSPRPGQQTLLVTKDSIRQLYQDSLESMRQQVDMSTARVSNISTLLNGNIAIASCRLEVRSRQEPGKILARPSQIEIFYQKQGRWYLAATIPMMLEITVLDQPTLSRFQTEQLGKTLSGSLCGIGVEIDKQPKGLLIKKLISGGSAEKFGLKTGQIITSIDQQDVKSMSLEEAIGKIQGPEGSTVTLELENADGSTMKKMLTRRCVVLSGVETKVLKGAIGYIHIQSFNEQTAVSVRKALDGFTQKKINSLILDLRGPNGGLYTSVKEIAQMFIQKDKTMWFEKYGNQQPKEIKSENDNPDMLPMVILTDNQTEAGELIAAAMKTNKRAVVAGQNTLGKSAIRSLQKNSDGQSTKKEIGKYLIAPGQPISGLGVQVDKPLNLTGKDVDILNHVIDILKTITLEKT